MYFTNTHNFNESEKSPSAEGMTPRKMGSDINDILIFRMKCVKRWAVGLVFIAFYESRFNPLKKTFLLHF